MKDRSTSNGYQYKLRARWVKLLLVAIASTQFFPGSGGVARGVTRRVLHSDVEIIFVSHLGARIVCSALVPSGNVVAIDIVTIRCLAISVRSPLGGGSFGSFVVAPRLSGPQLVVVNHRRGAGAVLCRKYEQRKIMR
ncbi:hypothetical protein DEU56DRAFT_169189 [Suillus clintonianus]|uniref:uncharacterized protein n=1 Tax=Suillus clintonianus TaxID=1904413 RepID=UPI001B86584C|nr:uncharacterized protein DEU56DRAFT_169189 [Suillus clintonianus]KAG2146276.1 hypothetical protein DEU56DRAFT_169189 [Suillus clintonianus]